MENPQPFESREEPPAEILLPPRPTSVTLLALGVLIIAMINLTRLILSLRHWSFLASIPGVSPVYIALTGFIWCGVGALLFWSLSKAKPWAPRLMEAAALTYALYYWLDHIFMMDHPLNGATGTTRALLPLNWPFAAGVTVICLAYVVWVLGRRKVKAYFGISDQTIPADPHDAAG